MLRDPLLLLLAYVIGSLPSGYLLVRIGRGVDVRQYGSSNVGAINVCSVAGPAYGAATLLADAGKAIVVVATASIAGAEDEVVAAAALTVMLGHAYSAWFLLRDRRFSEGKCVASGLGVLAGLAIIGALPGWVPLVPVAVWAAALAGPRLLTGRWPCISPATMTAALSVPGAVALANPASAYAILSAAMAGLVLLRHRNNLRRLRAGTEPRADERLALRPPLQATEPAKADALEDRHGTHLLLVDHPAI